MDSNFWSNKKSTNLVKNNEKTGIILIALTGGAAVFSSIVCFSFILPALRKFCLPFVPATTQQIENVFIALKGRTGKLIDLGSGDGRIVVEAGKKGFKSDGVELNPWLVFFSRISSFSHGLSKHTKFYCSDLWKFNLQPYENIIIFGVKEMMDDLLNKFNRELKDSVVVACRFPLPSKIPMKVIGSGIDKVWVYHFKIKDG